MGRLNVRVRFTNGLNSTEMLNDVLWHLRDLVHFEEVNNPEYLIFGPYGPPPPAGPYVRVGYYCENVLPNLDVCDWAFGVPYDDEVQSDRYCRIEWHGIRPSSLVKDIDDARRRPIPPRFCNFVFSNPVGYREDFFRALSRYKRVDAPGRSMNNVPSFDGDFATESDWGSRKRRYLSQYKFTIAFENCSARGYNTEKLTDAMMAGSIPIYFGNPEIERHFNTKSFINAHDYLPSRRHFVTRCVERLSRERYGRRDCLPGKFQPRFRKLMRILKPRLEFGADFSKLIDRIAALDRDDQLYRDILTEPWVTGNVPQSMEKVRRQWLRIFSSRLRV